MSKLNTSTGSSSGISALALTVPLQVSSRTFGAAKGGMSKVVTMVLCQDELYKSDGTATYVVDIFDLPQIRELGPMISQIRVHYVCEGGTTNFAARVTTYWSVMGRTWSSAVELLSAQVSTNTGTISAPYNTPAAFGLLMRYAIEVKTNSGAVVESGRLTVVLEIELKS